MYFLDTITSVNKFYFFSYISFTALPIKKTHISTEFHNSNKHNNAKKYVIEVQDHQQAMKYADPLTDLEETVRRGYNDPYNDRNFFMNKINEDYFQQQNTQTQGLLGKTLNPGSLTRQEIQRDAHVYDLTPQRVISESAGVRTNRIPASNHGALSSRFPLQIAPVVQEQAGKNTGIPHSPDSNNILSLLKEFNLKTHGDLIKNFVRKQPERSDRLNPLTGLPENLEDKAYGAVSSIESVGEDLLPKAHQSVVIDLNHLRKTDQKSDQRQRLAASRQLIASSSSEGNSQKARQNMSASLMAGTIGSNFDSIQSFLQADEILRKKMSNGF